MKELWEMSVRELHELSVRINLELSHRALNADIPQSHWGGCCHKVICERTACPLPVNGATRLCNWLRATIKEIR